MIVNRLPRHEPAAGPIKGRWRFLDPRSGELFEVDVIVTTPEGWAERPESSSPNWLARTFRGGVVVAMTVML